MKNEFKMSLFLAPISPVKDSKTGRVSQQATVCPSRNVTLQEVFRLITGDPALERLTQEMRLPLERGDKERFSELKRQTLPYVTPCGTFAYRKSDCLLVPSGLVVVDVDGLDSTQEAEALRGKLFDDAYLCPALCFISPSGRGVKAFVPYPDNPGSDIPTYIAENTLDVMNYVEYVYGDEQTQGPRKVDPSGKDIVRSCFLCHDPEALCRNHKS
ncbi:MAG: BT4734/BF3469 family protein [Parabacteroides sp.]|nr:BT4734/BF3469 family protein [Parabacteroides sp.]